MFSKTFSRNQGLYHGEITLEHDTKEVAGAFLELQSCLSLTRASSKHFKALWWKFSSLYQLRFTHGLKKSSYMWWELEISLSFFFFLVPSVHHVMLSEDGFWHTTTHRYCLFLFQEVLKQLQGTIVEDSKDSQGQIEFFERFKGEESLIIQYSCEQCIYNNIIDLI